MIDIDKMIIETVASKRGCRCTICKRPIKKFTNYTRILKSITDHRAVYMRTLRYCNQCAGHHLHSILNNLHLTTKAIEELAQTSSIQITAANSKLKFIVKNSHDRI